MKKYEVRTSTDNFMVEAERFDFHEATGHLVFITAKAAVASFSSWYMVTEVKEELNGSKEKQE